MSRPGKVVVVERVAVRVSRRVYDMAVTVL
jgi:hypothetical protein